MAKSSAERKAAQRARQSAAGERKLELVLDPQEMGMLEQNCAARRPGRAPYEMNEYIALLIRQDNARVGLRIKSIGKQRCGNAVPPPFAEALVRANLPELCQSKQIAA